MDKRHLFFYYLRLMTVLYHVYKIHASTFLTKCLFLYTMLQVTQRKHRTMLSLKYTFLSDFPYIIPRIPMIGRPSASQTTICMTVMTKPIFHHSPWPMKPAPKKIGVTPQP